MTALSLLLCLAAQPPDDALTTAEAVRGHFRHASADQPRPVRLDAVVVYHHAGWAHLYVQDKTGGVQVRVSDKDWPGWVRVGDVVRVTGLTHDGEPANAVRATRIDKADTPGAVAPVVFDLTPTRAHWLDGRLVEVFGTVRSRQVVGGVTTVVLARDGREVAVLYPGGRFPAGVQAGAQVVIRGVCATNYTRHRRIDRPARILVSDDSQIDVRSPGLPTPFDSPRVTAATIRELAAVGGEGGDLVRVTGVVTGVVAGRSGAKVFVQDATGPVVAVLGEGQTAPLPGRSADVVGTPGRVGEHYGLVGSEARPAADTPPPVEPATVALEQLAGGDFHGRLVRTEGTVMDVSFAARQVRVTAFSRGHFVEAFLESPGEMSGVVAGARVALTGVYDADRAGAGVLVLRSTADVRVQSGPPFWTAERAWAVFGGFGAVCVVGVLGLVAMRGQVRRATAGMQRQFEERERLRDQFAAAAQLEVAGRMAGGVAHEFNNLLTVINGCATLLTESLDGGRAAELADDIRLAGQRAAGLTENLLNVVRPKPVVPQPLDLNAGVRDAVHLAERMIGDRTTIAFDPDVALPVVVGDPGLVSQVVFNLVKNARDAMPDGGTIRVRTHTAVENGVTWARLVVTDTGTGITEAVRARMFEPFFTTKSAGQGTGLGLHLVRTHVSAMGGRVRCASEVGRGTTFEVDLPTTASVTDDMTPFPPPIAAPTPLSGEYVTTVLVVDDEDGVLGLAKRILELRGMTVLAARDADEAERVADAHPERIDLLLTDLLLPGLSGRELADRLRARRPGLRVAYMSGLSAEDAAEQGLLESTALLVRKPFRPPDLTAAVARALGAVAG